MTATTPSAPPSPVASDDPHRLLGEVEFSHAPRAVLDPRQTTRAPRFETDQYAWTPRETFDQWIQTLDNDTLWFRNSMFEAYGLYGSLKGATVADVGAAYGNNLLFWKDLLGPDGHSHRRKFCAD